METREPQLKDYFAKFGTVDYVSLKMNPATGTSRCFAFVVFKEAQDVVRKKFYFKLYLIYFMKAIKMAPISFAPILNIFIGQSVRI